MPDVAPVTTATRCVWITFKTLVVRQRREGSEPKCEYRVKSDAMRQDGTAGRTTTLLDMFETRLRASNDCRAVGFGDCWMTFQELDDAASSVAGHLVELGVAPGDFVALAVPRSITAVIGVLATWKAGAAYVPIDLAAPEQHRQSIMRDSRAVALIGGEEVSGAPLWSPPVRLLDIEPREPDPRWRPDEPAWVLYTSGSTGRPKGVVGSHRGSFNRCQWLWDTDPFDQDEVAVQNTGLTVVDSVWEIWAPLCAGVPLVVPPEDASRDVDQLIDVLASHGVTRVCLVPSLLRSLLDAHPDLGDRLPRVRKWVCSGDSLDAKLVERFYRCVPTATLFNQYGLTESCADVTSYDTRLWSGSREIPIGRPISGTSVYVVNRDLRPVPPGQVGELCLSGNPVALGYLNAPERDGQRFVRHHDLGPDGGRLLRTGDLVRERADGVLEHLGRIDRQVKIRGHRVEPEGVETILRAISRVRSAVVRTWLEPSGTRLAAYVVPVDLNDPPSSAELRKEISSALPRHAVPRSFEFLDELPLTSSGKVDYSSLPAPRAPTMSGPSLEPRTDVERVVASFFRESLGTKTVGVHDDFFELGGESLLAMQLVARVNREFNVATNVRSFVANPTVAAVSALLMGGDRSPQPGQRSRTSAVATLPEGGRHLSATQRAMWLHERSSDVAGLYNVWVAFHVSGPLDVDALERASDAVVRAHESLRMAIVDRPYAPSYAIVTDRVSGHYRHDCSGMDEATLLAFMSDRAHEPFDLSAGQLLRLEVMTCDHDDHKVLVTVHHIACDGRSLAVLLEDLSAGFQAEVDSVEVSLDGSVLPSEPIAGVRDMGAGRTTSPGELVLPADLPRNGRPTRAGRTFDFDLDTWLSERVSTAARRLGSTPFMIALAAFAHALRTVSGEDRFTISVPIIDGPPPRAIGCFMRTVQVPVDLSGGPTAHEALSRLRDALWSASASGPLEDEPPTHSGGVLFAYDDDHGERFQLVPSLRVSPLRVAGRTSKVDLSLYLDRGERSFLARLEYLSPHFDDRAITSLAKRFALALERFSADDDLDEHDLPSLVDDDRRLLDEWNSTGADDYPVDRCLHELLGERIALAPHAVVACGADRRTHAEVAAAATHVARSLAARGLGPGDVVGVHLERSVDLLVAIFGVMKTGCAYLPLEPGHPQDRLMTYVTTAGARLVVTDSIDGGGWPSADVPWANVASLLAESEGATTLARRKTLPSSPAYVIFTSGSTGLPKGVIVPHSAVVNHVTWMQKVFKLDASDCVLLKTSVGFDVSVWELFVPFLSGSRVEIAKPGGHLDQAYLAERIAVAGVTTAVFVPSTLQLFLDHPASVPCRVRRLWVIGEVLPPDLASRATDVLGAEVHNLYGPTEATVAVTWWPCPRGKRPDEPVFIGRPVANTECLVLDKGGRIAPVGAPGELAIAGAQLATGYIGRPDLTMKHFSRHPERPGERVYRTADLVRWRWDGELEYLGRIDQQLKVAGVRVEPAEIEVTLRGCPGINDAVVLPDTEVKPTSLVAFVVANDGATVVADDVRAHVAARLPAALVPRIVVKLEGLPRLSNGKVDQRGLRALRDGRVRRSDLLYQAATDAPVDLAANPVERRSQVQELWEMVTGAQPVAGRAFIDSGGDSMTAVRLAMELVLRTGVEVSPHVVLDAADVEALIESVEWHVESRAAFPDVEPGDLMRQSVTSRTSPIQERWFHLLPSGVGHIDILCEVSGPLDQSTFKIAVRELAERHAILRSVYDASEPPVQRVVDGWAPEPVVRRATPDNAASVLAEAIDRSLVRFDVTQEVPFELDLVSLNDQHGFLVGRTHHIAGDGWSTSVLLEDFERVYTVVEAGGDPRRDLAPAPQYGAFADAQLRHRAGPAFREVRKWWQRAFEGAAGPTSLPVAERGLGPEADQSAEFIPVSFPSRALRAEARRNSSTVFMMLVTAFAATLRDATGEEDLIFGTSFGGRNLSQSDQTVGVFVNPLPVRIAAPHGASVVDLVPTSRAWLLDAARHQDYYLSDLVRHVEPFVGRGLNDVFDAHIVLQNFPPPSAGDRRRYDVLDSQDLSRPRPFNIPLARSRIMRAFDLIVFPHRDEFTLVFGYKPARIPTNQATAWTEAYVRHLTRLASGG